MSIHGDVSDDGVVARPRGRVQFFGVGTRGTWTRFDLLSVAGSNVSSAFSSARDATAAIGTARPSVVRRRGPNRCAKRAGSTRQAATADLADPVDLDAVALVQTVISWITKNLCKEEPLGHRARLLARRLERARDDLKELRSTAPTSVP